MSEGQSGSRFWIGAQLVLAFGLGFCLVWLNIERVNLAYDLRSIEGDIDKLRNHVSKLEVERNNLMSPHRLQQLAGSYGLAPAVSGQMRRIEAPALAQ